MATKYEAERASFLKHFHRAEESNGRYEEVRTSPLISLQVKYGVSTSTRDDGVQAAAASLETIQSDETIKADATEESQWFSKAKKGGDSESDPFSRLFKFEISKAKPEDSVGNDGSGNNGEDLFPQYSLLGFNIGAHPEINNNEPILVNTFTPSSTFICGSQHSGKSYTLSCLLEACLVPKSGFGPLPHPLAGVVFHYDVDATSSLSEVAALCSAGVKVNVLVSRSNYHELSRAYGSLPGAAENLKTYRLLLKDKHLNIDRMHRLMALSESEKGIPLYMEVIQQILRDMAINGTVFEFRKFEQLIKNAGLEGGQKKMLELRMTLLRSFMETCVKANERPGGVDIFNPQPGTLTIIDLSDPLIDSSFACILFDICLGLFKRFNSDTGMVVALDEAHKYLDGSAAAATFTERVLTTVREQRHNNTRIIIATQEPTLSTKLLDLCSTSIVHRFTSPAWFDTIKGHLSGASGLIVSTEEQKQILDRIVNLNTGESLVFSPSSYVCQDDSGAKKLGTGILKMKTRMRNTADSGRSKMAGSANAFQQRFDAASEPTVDPSDTSSQNSAAQIIPAQNRGYVPPYLRGTIKPKNNR